MTRKACVVGWPVEHSRSPLIHNYWLKKYSLDGAYERIAVEPERVATFIHSLDFLGYSGCNVTLPFKEVVFGLVEPADETTRRLGAVNTIYFQNGHLRGINTDGEGFLANLAANGKSDPLSEGKAFILGAGGAAMAIVNALLESNMSEIIVCNRTLDRSEKLRERFGKWVVACPWEYRSAALQDCDLLVNTTSLGMKDKPSLEIDLRRLQPHALVADVVYNPLVTPLLKAARSQGNPTVTGLGMLLYQAVRGFELWFGVRPVVSDELYDLVARTIEPVT